MTSLLLLLLFSLYIHAISDVASAPRYTDATPHPGHPLSRDGHCDTRTQVDPALNSVPHPPSSRSKGVRAVEAEGRFKGVGAAEDEGRSKGVGADEGRSKGAEEAEGRG